MDASRCRQQVVWALAFAAALAAASAMADGAPGTAPPATGGNAARGPAFNGADPRARSLFETAAGPALRPTMDHPIDARLPSLPSRTTDPSSPSQTARPDAWDGRRDESTAFRSFHGASTDRALVSRPSPIAFGPAPGDPPSASMHCSWHRKHQPEALSGDQGARLSCGVDPGMHRPLAAMQLGSAQVSLETNRTLTVSWGW